VLDADPPDGRADGNKVGYLDDPNKWRGYDPPLFDVLKSAVHDQPPERLREIERSGIVPGSDYFNDMLAMISRVGGNISPRQRKS